MFSVVIPIGKFPFFVDACLGNIYSTAGDEIDVVFLTYNKISPSLQSAFDRAAQSYRFRVLSAPFHLDLNHLPLLDWAMAHPDLPDWVLVQHCDLFWHPEHVGWVSYIKSQLDGFALYPPDNARFTLDGQDVPTMHDFVAVYHRPTFIKEKLSFMWTTVDKDVKLSEPTRTAIEGGRLQWKELRSKFRNQHPASKQILPGIDWLDGSINLTLEAAVRLQGQVKPLKWPFFHLWQFFKIAHHIKRSGPQKEILEVSGHKYSMLAFYSWITSFCFDKDEFRDVILPWKAMQVMPRPNGFRINRTLIDHLASFCSETNVAGDKDLLGVERIVSPSHQIDLPTDITLL